jgi:transposase
VEREGLDAFDVIGQESRGVLERRPASCVFVEVVRKKFVRKADKQAAETTVLIADPLPLPIAKGIAGPGLLAETIVKRWCDHQPLHRQEGIFARDGLELARSTLSDWHIALAALAAPLIQAMKMDAFQAPYLCTDATGVLVQAPERCKNGHFWVLVAPEKHVLFEFSQKHDSDATAKLLDGYSGYLVADAHTVYDHLSRSPGEAAGRPDHDHDSTTTTILAVERQLFLQRRGRWDGAPRRPAGVPSCVGLMQGINAQLVAQAADLRRKRPRSKTLERLERQLLPPFFKVVKASSAPLENDAVDFRQTQGQSTR